MTTTVVISSYKYGHLAAHCIESVLSQSKMPDKIFFVDDGVGDCEHLQPLYPEVEFVLRENNLGVVDNFDDMLYRVKTERCMFLGADNWLRSDALELLSQKTTDIVTYDVVFTGLLKEDRLPWHKEEVTLYQGDYYWDRTGKHHGSMLYKTELAQRFGYRKRDSLDNKSEEDWVLWDNMLSVGATHSHVKEGLLYYRRHRENYFKYGKTKNRGNYGYITKLD